MARIDEMEAIFAETSIKAQRVESMEGAITVLKEHGLLRQMGDATFKAVESWEEKQQLL